MRLILAACCALGLSGLSAMADPGWRIAEAPVAPPAAVVGRAEADVVPPAALPRPPEQAPHETRSAWICGLIADAAREHGLPSPFFARLIWKESRFDEKAISPVGAQGIAQFMPGTAKLVGLKDPWNPAEAIPASASHLADLRANLGNWGLAAAAYNAGEGRIWRWLKGTSRLPGETIDYVHSITFRPAEWFRTRRNEVEPRPLDDTLSFDEACRSLPIMKTRALNATATAAARKPWGAQVAGHLRRGVAMRQFERYRRRFSAVIGGHKPQVVAKRRARGARAVFTVQLGFDSRRGAIRMCSRLRQAGGACIVRRN